MPNDAAMPLVPGMLLLSDYDNDYVHRVEPGDTAAKEHTNSVIC